MSSSEPGRRRALLHCATDADVLVEISDARGRKVWSDYGDGAVDLPHGLYRVDLERHGRITSEHIDLDRSIELRTFVPPSDTPVPIAGAACWDAVHVEVARRIGHRDTRAPVGESPTTSRLLVQVHCHGHQERPTSLLSEPLTIHDRDGREIAAVTPDQAYLDGAARIAALSCAVAPGTYRLRAVRTRRDVAITIPAGYAARVFAADHGAIALGDLRVSITPLDREFDPRRIERSLELECSLHHKRLLVLPAWSATAPRCGSRPSCAAAVSSICWKSGEPRCPFSSLASASSMRSKGWRTCTRTARFTAISSPATCCCATTATW